MHKAITNGTKLSFCLHVPLAILPPMISSGTDGNAIFAAIAANITPELQRIPATGGGGGGGGGGLCLGLYLRT